MILKYSLHRAPGPRGPGLRPSGGPIPRPRPSARWSCQAGREGEISYWANWNFDVVDYIMEYNSIYIVW